MTLLARQAGRRSQGTRPLELVRELAAHLTSHSGDQLRDAVDELRDSAADADSSWTPRMAALVVEAFRRAKRIDLYDTQLLAGLILCDRPSHGAGFVAEMQTGEGKTFAAAFPAVAFALHGRGVHVATSNAYLAARDAGLLQPVYEALDLVVESLPEATDGGSPEKKSNAYQADITYGPGYEFGFDYLRDQLARREASGVRRFRDRYRNPLSFARIQRPLFAAVIDEIDHVLLDDATSPLVLAAAGAEEAADAVAHIAARQLAVEFDDSDLIRRASGIDLSDRGRERAHERLTETIASRLKRPWIDYVTQAVHAEHVLRRDVHYVIDAEDKAQIIDPSTGRIFADRTWSDGLHQAVEAKEGLPIRDDNRTLARITRQRFSGLYRRLCGMTGTATGSEKEFHTIYGLRVESVPTRRRSQRAVGPLWAFPSADERWAAVVAEVGEHHRQGRPVLVGTTSISASEHVSALLAKQNLRHAVLNGLQDADEASVVEAAGLAGAITVATGIAGRGTDIALGPNVRELGGLHVVVAEAQPSARVERQLIGRAARQGDPGSASRYIAPEDAYLAEPAPWLAARMQAGAREVESTFRRVQRQTDQKAAKQRITMWNRDGKRDDLVSRLA